jgi:exodeoxyribonuclease VII small subunit
VSPPESEKLSYEQAREELVSVVQRLESGGAPLEESLALWERGEQLAAICQEWLDGARARISATRNAADRDDAGNAGAEDEG